MREEANNNILVSTAPRVTGNFDPSMFQMAPDKPRRQKTEKDPKNWTVMKWLIFKALDALYWVEGVLYRIVGDVRVLTEEREWILVSDMKNEYLKERLRANYSTNYSTKKTRETSVMELEYVSRWGSEALKEFQHDVMDNPLQEMQVDMQQLPLTLWAAVTVLGPQFRFLIGCFAIGGGVYVLIPFFTRDGEAECLHWAQAMHYKNPQAHADRTTLGAYSCSISYEEGTQRKRIRVHCYSGDCEIHEPFIIKEDR